MVTPIEFSIITPSGNSPKLLAATVASVASHPRRLQHFVVGQKAVNESQNPGHWIRVDDSAVDAVSAVNQGLRRATGDIVAWLSAGDLYFPEALSSVEEFFREHPDVDVVYGDAVLLDEENRIQGEFKTKPWQVRQIQHGCCLCQPAVFLRRRVIEQHGLLNEGLRFWADYDYWLRLAQAGVRFEKLPRLLASCRVVGGANALGALERDRSLEAVEELNSLFHQRLGFVPSRWLLHEGRVAAYHAGTDHTKGRRYYIDSLQNACRAALRWNGIPWYSPRVFALLPAQHARHEWRLWKRYPEIVKSLLPRPKVNFPNVNFNFLSKLRKPRLFNLRQHPPRPLAIPASYRAVAPLNRSPTISIVTPNLNQGAFIEATLQSVLSQEYPQLEYIVQDGGSKDESVEVIQRFSDRLTHWASEPDRGQTQAINRGMRHATGEIMAYLNSDDILLPGALAYVAKYFEDHPHVDVLYSHRVLIDAQGDEIGRWVLPPHDDYVLSFADYIPQETMFWRRRIWDRVGGTLDESFQFAMDWDLILRFRDAGAKFARVPRFLGAFRITDDQKSTQQIMTTGRREMDRLRQRVLARVPDSEEIHRVIRPYLRRHWLWDRMYLAGIIQF